jgi:ribosomal protein L37AE/L43A
MEVPDFEPPVCPKCGAEDPLLESVDPLNTWLCEICGEQWTDPAPE